MRPDGRAEGKRRDEMTKCTACEKTATTTYIDFLGFEWPSCEEHANEMNAWHDEQAEIAARYDGNGNYRAK